MKFLVDNQLPLALCRFLNGKGHTSTHVLDVGLDEAKDSAIWKYATENSLVVIAKDEDFLRHAIQANAKTSFVWVRLPNCRNQVLLEAFDKALPAIIAALESGQRVVELR